MYVHNMYYDTEWNYESIKKRHIWQKFVEYDRICGSLKLKMLDKAEEKDGSIYFSAEVTHGDIIHKTWERWYIISS